MQKAGNIDLMGLGEIQNAKLQGLSANPETLTERLFWYDNVNHEPVYYNGTTIKPFGRVYNNFTGADGINAGASGLVPAPAATDNTKFLCGDGTFKTPAGTTYTEGTGIDITNAVISIDDTVVATKTDLLNYQTEISDANKLSADYIVSGRTNLVVTQSEKNTWNGKQDAISSSNKLSSDLVDDTNKTNKFVTASEKTAIGTISNKADKATTLSGYGITDAYTKTEVDGMVSAGMHYKGTKASVSALPSSGNQTGDLWNVTDTGANYAWNGSEWDKLSENIDLSGKQDVIDSSHKLSSDLVDDTNKTNKFVTSTEKSTWNGKQDALSSSNKLSPSYINTSASNRFVTDTEKSTWNGKQNALGYTPCKKYTTTNPALTKSGGVCTWTVTHNIGGDVQVQVFNVSTKKLVGVNDVTLTSDTVCKIELLSSSNIAAGTYKVVVIG